MGSKLDYGIDAPGVVRNIFLAGFLCVVCSRFVKTADLGSVHILLDSSLLSVGVVFLAESILMLFYSKVGKFRHRDRMIRMITWRGDERVLDIGTGRGLLLIGAAKHLTTGNGMGIDIWSEKDLSANSRESTIRNVELEGVAGKVQLESEDAQQMSFEDESFDVVLSNLCLHNIPTAAGRDKACEEVARVLKPGGTAIVSDFRNLRSYASVFRAAGLQVRIIWPRITDILTLLWIVEATKPVRAN